MKRTLSAAVVILTFAITSAAQANCARHIETAGGLSFCPPEGWIEEKKAEDKYSRFFGPAQEGFTANLNIKDETSALLLPDYVAGSIKRILLPASAEKMGATSVKLVNQSEFITTSSLRGFKVEFRTEWKSWVISTVQYYFEAALDNKFVVTLTSVEAQRAKLDPVCDDSVKTFRLEKQVDLTSSRAPEEGSLSAGQGNSGVNRQPQAQHSAARPPLHFCQLHFAAVT
jgi:hypothetical protein